MKEYGRVQYPSISAEIHTEHSDFKITNDYGNDVGKVNNTSFQSDIVSLQSTNSISRDSSTCVVELGGDIRWDKVINENDIIIIRIDPHKNNGKSPINTNIFTGLVAEVREESNYSSDNILYQITAQDFSSVFSSYGIGMISQVDMSLSSMGWLWDSTASASYSDSDSGDADSSISGGTIQQQVWNYFKGAGYTDKATAAIMGQMQAESNFQVGASNQTEAAGQGSDYANGASRNGIGLLQFTGNLHTYLVQQTGGDWKDLKKQLKAINSAFQSYGLKASLNKASSVDSAMHTLYFSVLGVGAVMSDPYAGNTTQSFTARESYAKKFLKKYTGTGGSSSGSDDDSSSGDSNDPTEAAAEKEKESSIGVPFFGNNVAGVEDALVDRFKPYIRYSYDNTTKTIWDFLDYSNMSSWDQYEYLWDSSSFVNFKGTLFDLQEQSLAAPFCEMFYDSLSNGKSHLVIRRAPFNPDDWSQLDSYTASSEDILTKSIAKTKLQQCSVFVVDPADSQITGVQNGVLMSVFPQYHQSLIDKYGYSIMEYTNPYVAGTGSSSEKGLKAKKSTDNTKGKLYSYEDVVAYLNSLDKTELRLKQTTVAATLANKANNISAAQAESIVSLYIANAYKITDAQFSSAISEENGGGTPNTGIYKLSYSEVNKLIKNASGSASTFISSASAYFDNVSYEFLLSLWLLDRTSSGGISKKDYNSAVKKYRGEGNKAEASDTEDLRAMTQMLFNWYADNFNFYSGDITLSGDPDIRVGSRLDIIDNLSLLKNGYPGMRYYVEEVTQQFSFTDGYTTVLGVTRGMRMPKANEEDPRFTNLWGQSSDFKGGYMGEPSIANIALANDSDSSADSSTGSAFTGPKGNAVAVNAAKYAYTFRKDVYKERQEIYALGGYGERGSVNPLTNDINNGKLILDCSSFVYWCFSHFGANVGNVTTTIFNDTALFDKVSISSGSTSGMKIGDLVFLYNCGHVMFYIGGGMLLGWNGGLTNASYDTSGGCQATTLGAMGGTHDGTVLRYR